MPRYPTRRDFLAAAAALPLTLPGCRSGGLGSPGTVEYLDRALPRWMERFDVPGAVIVTLDEAAVNWSATFGVRLAGAPGRVDARTIFEAASMSKPLFAWAVMKLVEDGVLDLDRPLDDYLPEPYAPEAPATSRITARMVLSHTTGLPNWRKRRGTASPLYLLHPPGSEFTYSGEGFVYLQTVVGHLVDGNVGQYLNGVLLPAMDMSCSSYTWRDSYRENYAHGHDASGAPREYRFKRNANTASSLYTTPVQYARYIRAMIGVTTPEGLALGPSSIAAMLTPESRKLDGFCHGLGWGLCHTLPGRRIVYHGGSNSSGHRCLCAFDRESGTGFVLMTNGKGGAALRRAVAETVFPGARLGDALGS